MTDLRQSPQYARYVKTIGWKVVTAKINIFIKKIPLLPFSIIKIQRPDFIPFEKIDKVAKEHRALLVKIEPKTCDHKLLANHGYRQDSWPLLPTKTIWIDLKKTENQLWKEMEKDTRYCIKKTKKNNLIIEQFNNRTIDQLYESFKKFGKGYIPKKKELQSLMESFSKSSLLLTAKSQDEILAGTLVLLFDQAAYYYYAFTSPSGRKIFAQYSLVWRAIKMTKKLGCRIFDMEGIEDSRYKVTRKWRGFSHFKKSFGGKEITFPGSFTKYYHPIAKLLLPRLA